MQRVLTYHREMKLNLAKAECQINTPKGLQSVDKAGFTDSSFCT